MLDKIVLKFIADVLYLKGILVWSEYDAILSAKNFSDLDSVVERMLRGGFSSYLRGEIEYHYGDMYEEDAAE